MSATENNLIFFNSQGDALNFLFNPTSNQFEGKLFFDPNSSDTFKTIGLYLLERVPGFVYSNLSETELVVETGITQSIFPIAGTGSGTTLDPYILNIPSDVNNIRNSYTASFLLNNNIDMSGFGTFTPIPTFSGILNGNNLQIQNLHIFNPTNGGLFLVLENAVINNLHLNNISVNVSGTASVVGTLAGSVINSIVQQSFCIGTISVASVLGSLGGFIGDISNSSVNNSYSIVDLPNSNAASIGGFIGTIVNSSASNCYSAGYVNNNKGFVGVLVGNTVSSCYYDEDASGVIDTTGGSQPKTTSEMQTQSTFIGWNFVNIWNFFTNEYPQLNVGTTSYGTYSFTYSTSIPNDPVVILDKYQLFNEYGINLTPGVNKFIPIKNISAVNNDILFYSKWIYSQSIEVLFPIGTELIFDSSIAEFNNVNITYTVVAHQKGAIMIISNMNNNAFNTAYSGILNNPNTYINKTISGVNTIQVLNYADSHFNEILSSWNQPDFGSKAYNGKKLTIVNSTSNSDDGIYTINNSNISDKLDYITSVSNIPLNQMLIIQLELLTDLPLLYSGSLIFNSSTNIINFGNAIPNILTSETQFVVRNSISNNIILNVSNIPTFNPLTSYVVGNQVLYNNVIEQCILNYTASSINNILPTNNTFWTNPTYLPIQQTIINETLSNGELYLTTNILNFTASWTDNLIGLYNESRATATASISAGGTISNIYVINTGSGYESVPIVGITGGGGVGAVATAVLIDGEISTINIVSGGSGYTTSPTITIDPSPLSSNILLSSAATLYQPIFANYNINLYYNKISKLTAQLNYLSNYANVSYFIDSISPTSSVTITQNQNVRILSLVEDLNKYDFNANISSLNSYTVIFTALDNSGLYINVNNIVMFEPTSFVFSSPTVIDQLQTVNNTISNWYSNNFMKLATLGIFVALDLTEQKNYYDTVILSTEYPNVTLNFEVLVGLAASYFIKHSDVIFYDIGNIFTIVLNGISFTQNFTVDIPTTLSNWILNNNVLVSQFNISVSSNNNVLTFKLLLTNTPIIYSILLGKSFLPGSLSYEIINYILGNQGLIIAGNEVLNNVYPTINLENEGFATGMITSINNSFYPLNNQEYNIIYLDPTQIGLSYQGPFWGVTQEALLNAFNDGFNLGFGSSATVSISLLTGTASSTFQISFDGGPTISIPQQLFDSDPLFLSQNQFGTLDPNYVPTSYITLTTREFLRRPRENFSSQGDVQVQYQWTWSDDTTSQIFIYDFSGNMLPTGASLSYIGPKPLSAASASGIRLNSSSNSNINHISLSQYQQTIFPYINYMLDFIDSPTDINSTPVPLELFLGFNDINEGVVTSNLLLQKIENISFDIISAANNNIITFSLLINGSNTTSPGLTYGSISLDPILSDINFTEFNLKIGQTIQLKIVDNTNITKQALNFNNGLRFIIRAIYTKNILVDFITDDVISQMIPGTTMLLNYPISGTNTFFTTTISVVPVNIGSFQIYGQTEIEDIRYKVELDNVGKNILPDDVFIFRNYNINEEGVDWTFLNKKRKEMLSVKNDIYNYIGSYKSIINAINFFGYNDLELFEYYRNINTNSINFDKLFKVEIPDIFTIGNIGWNELDYLKLTLPNPNYETTNLFNLTYRITDITGDILDGGFTLDEVIIKLNGLKKWLETNIIPISHRILDITGKTDFVGESIIQHNISRNQDIKIKGNFTPINMSINEAYLLPIDSGSSVYNVVVDFDVACLNNLPDYYNLKVRTYETFPEWQPFNTYNIGDSVVYLSINNTNNEIVYISAIDNNQLNNPITNQNAPLWSQYQIYQINQIVNYQNRIYQYDSLFNGTSSNSPLDNSDWVDITIWEVDVIRPIQTLEEFRLMNLSATASSLLPYNFTVDINIDPYISLELLSDNGYGQNYSVKKYIDLSLFGNIPTFIPPSN